MQLHDSINNYLKGEITLAIGSHNSHSRGVDRILVLARCPSKITREKKQCSDSELNRGSRCPKQRALPAWPPELAGAPGCTSVLVPPRSSTGTLQKPFAWRILSLEQR